MTANTTSIGLTPLPVRRHVVVIAPVVAGDGGAIPDQHARQHSQLIGAQVEPLAAPLTPQEQVEQPYTFGTTQIVPVMNPKFVKTGEVSVVFLIYNTAQDANKKPDVAVEYSFYQKLAAAEKFFNKTSPQAFNATTLPPQFDPAAGHQLVAGQSVPLASFPEGDYRLEIKVTDKLSGKTLTQNVIFKVTS